MGDPLRTGFTRVFMIEGRARGDREPMYESSMRMTALDYAFGDIEDIKVPDPNNYDNFKIVGQVRGEEERPTTSLQGRYAIDVRSELLRLAKIGCAVDVQLHMGACTDPSIFNEFQKAIVLEDVLLTNFGTDDLGALSPDERAVVNETADLSATALYEILPLLISAVATDIVANEIVDIVVADAITCGECATYSDGCQKVFSVEISSAGGSPAMIPAVIYSIDGGSSWWDHDIDSLLANEDPSGIGVVSGYVVVVSLDSCSHHYADAAEFDTVTDPTFTEVTQNYNPAGCPNDIWSVGPGAFIVGEGGYVYYLSDPTGGPDVVDSGSASGGDDLLAVHALDDETAVAVGNNGAVVFTTNRTLWSASSTRPVGAGIDLNCVWMREEDEWWVGTSDGRLFYTLDQGTTWTEQTFPGSGAGVVQDIQFPSDSVGYLSHTTAAPAGRLLRSYDGGYSWQVLPEGTTITPANDRFTAIASCAHDVNALFAGGLADDATDGIIVVGKP